MMIEEVLERLRQRRPLVHVITNYVTIRDCANILLACGASPVMADAPQEAAAVTARCDGLVVNLGMLNEQKREAIRLSCAAAAANKFDRFVIEEIALRNLRLRKTKIYRLKL